MILFAEFDAVAGVLLHCSVAGSREAAAGGFLAR
jgi:hypothetical protein